MLAPALAVLLAAAMPAFEAVDVSGETLKSTELAGEITVFNFWMTGCGPCVSEIGSLNALVARHPDVRFIAVALDERRQVEQFTARQPFTYRQVPDGARLAAAFGANGYPTHAVVDREGRVVARFFGADRAAEKVEAVVRWLMSGAPSSETPELGHPPETDFTGLVRVGPWAWPIEVSELIARLEATRPRVAKAVSDRLRASNAGLAYGVGARIVVGQLQLEGGGDARAVTGPLEVLEGGYFVEVVRDDDPPWVLNGYDPLHFAPSAEVAQWVGTVTVRRLPPAELGVLTGRVLLPPGGPAQAKVTVRPARSRYAYGEGLELRPDGARAVALDAKGGFRARGLSPGLQCIEVVAAQSLTWERCVEVRSGLTTTTRPIALERARVVQLRLVERRGGAFRLEDVEALTVQPARDWSVGGVWQGPVEIEGRLVQQQGRLTFYTGCEAQDLGDGPLERHASATWREDQPTATVEVRNEAVYLLQCSNRAHYLLSLSEARRK